MPFVRNLVVLCLSAAVLVACGERGEPASATPLRSPSAAVVEPESCDAASAALPRVGPLGRRQMGTLCLRHLNLLEPAPAAAGLRRRALADPPSRLITAAELFNWAEAQYGIYFPPTRPTHALSPYVYRYYPETDNHLAVAGDGRIYIQGPVSGGGLAFVGTLEEFTCRVDARLCAAAQDCAAVTEWRVGANRCVPNPGQAERVADGAVYTFFDTVAPTLGVASYRCSAGTLIATGTTSCEPPAAADCDTSAVRWTVAGNECTPNANEPRSIPSGVTYTFFDSVLTTGRASYSCSNGSLSGPTNASCAAAPVINCAVPAVLDWTVGGQTCQADPGPATIADGSAYEFPDSADAPSGSALFRCRSGSLQLEGTPVCAPGARMRDSFGGDGGAADGGASADGTAGDGAPIVGSTVRIVDRNSVTSLAVTDSRGYWRARIGGMVPPMVISVRRPDGQFRYSLNTRQPRTNGYLFIAVTGLTDKIVSDLSAAAGFGNPAAVTPAMLANLGPGAVDTAVRNLRADLTVRTELVNAGLSADNFDPLTTPFRADGTGYDRVLDNLVVDITSDGLRVLRPRSCTVGLLSWTVAGATCSVQAGNSTLAAGSSQTFRDNDGPTTGAATYSCDRGLLVGPTLATCVDSTRR